MGVWCDLNNFFVLFINKFLHTRVFGWVVVLRANAPDDGRTYPKHVELRIHQ